MNGWPAGLAIAALVAWPARRSPAARLAGWRESSPAVATRDGQPDAGQLGAGLTTAVVIAVVVVVFQVPVVSIAALVVAAAVGLRIRRARRESALRSDRRAATAEVTIALAAELRAGRTPAQALAAVAALAGPLRPGLDAAAAAVAVGVPAGGELARAALLPGAERLRYVAAAWSVAESAGGQVAVVLERLGEAMDGDDELRAELDAAMAGPRATMFLLAALPLLGLALGQSVGARPVGFLIHRPLGWGLLGAASVLDLLGVVATRAIARSALRT